MGIESAYPNSKDLQGKGVAPSPDFNWSQLESHEFDVEKLTRIIKFVIGHNLDLEQRRARYGLWKVFENFPDEDSARVFIERSFWPKGPVCPRCRSGDHVGSGTSPYRCNACDRQFTVRLGTIFEGSHVQLHYWLWAVLIFAGARHKISSTKLAFLLGVSQPTASSMIRKLRAEWYPLWDILVDQRRPDLDFIYLYAGPRWNFHSHQTRTKETLEDLARMKERLLSEQQNDDQQDDPYRLTPEESLIPLELIPSLERAKEIDAQREEHDKLRQAEKTLVRKIKWSRAKDNPSNGMRRYIGWIAQRTERTRVHVQDHLSLIPFRWLPQKDCPICCFGDQEWRHWESIAPQLGLILWQEFWDWIEDLRREHNDQIEMARHEDEFRVYPIKEPEPRVELDMTDVLI